MTSVVSLGFIAGTLAIALTGIADRQIRDGCSGGAPAGWRGSLAASRSIPAPLP
jgi:hypothetical protein